MKNMGIKILQKCAQILSSGKRGRRVIIRVISLFDACLYQWFLNWGNLPSEGKLTFLGG